MKYTTLFNFPAMLSRRHMSDILFRNLAHLTEISLCWKITVLNIDKDHSICLKCNKLYAKTNTLLQKCREPVRSFVIGRSVSSQRHDSHIRWLFREIRNRRADADSTKFPTKTTWLPKKYPDELCIVDIQSCHSKKYHISKPTYGICKTVLLF